MPHALAEIRPVPTIWSPVPDSDHLEESQEPLSTGSFVQAGWFNFAHMLIGNTFQHTSRRSSDSTSIC
jgi:hypothetical protein